MTKIKSPRPLPTHGISPQALKAFGIAFTGAEGSGFRRGSNNPTVELTMRREALTRIALIIDITGSRRKTQDLLCRVFTKSIKVFEDLIGNLELHPIYMSGGVVISQGPFTKAEQAFKNLELTDVKNGPTNYIDVMEILRTKRRHLEEQYPNEKLVHPGHPEAKLVHANFDALLFFPDRFEDKPEGVRTELANRYRTGAKAFLQELGEFNVPAFVFHEETSGSAGYGSQLRTGFDSLQEVFIPAAIKVTNGSYLSFQKYDEQKIMGAIVSTAIILLGGSEEMVKHIMEIDPVRGLIERGEFDPKLIETLHANNTRLLPPPPAPNEHTVIPI